MPPWVAIPRLVRAPGTRCIVLLSVLVLASASACRGVRVPRSDWPPDDFFLEVRASTQTGDRSIDRQSLHVFADGFAVYREADPLDALPGEWPPVFATVSAYRMLPQSTRSLARSLYRVGLFQAETVVGTDVDAEEVVAIRWRAFGEERRTIARGRVYGVVVEALHVINAYLPAGHAFELPDMTGEPEPPRLSRVPVPARSVDDAYAVHAAWAADWDDPDLEWRLELFGLALRSGHADRAHELLEEFERERQQHVAVFPDDAGLTQAALQRLRELLGDARPRNGSRDG